VPMTPVPALSDSGLCWWGPRIVREPDARQLRLDLVAPEEGRDPDPPQNPANGPWNTGSADPPLGDSGNSLHHTRRPPDGPAGRINP
jgi:hypothetical protein